MGNVGLDLPTLRYIVTEPSDSFQWVTGTKVAGILFPMTNMHSRE